MSCKIAIASGKGGTGKTTLAVSLFRLLSRIAKDQNHPGDGRVMLVDCDVEEPNDLIFFSKTDKLREEIANQLIPSIDTDKCNFCRKCADYCEFNAIVLIPPAGFAQVDPNLCHSCGACLIACAQDAITENPKEIGKLNFYNVGGEAELAEGRLKIGSAMQTMLIKILKKVVSDKAGIVIFDAPPGTSCSVVATISDSDFVVLVAEPTLFGMHDFKLMVRLIRELGLPFGTVINKAGVGNNDLEEYIRQEGITLLGKIPFDRDFASLYAKGRLFDSSSKSISCSLEQILENIQAQLKGVESLHP